MIAALVFGMGIVQVINDWELMKSEMPERSYISKDNVLTLFCGLCSACTGVGLYVVLGLLFPIDDNLVADAAVLAGKAYLAAGVIALTVGGIWFVINLHRRNTSHDEQV